VNSPDKRSVFARVPRLLRVAVIVVVALLLLPYLITPF